MRVNSSALTLCWVWQTSDGSLPYPGPLTEVGQQAETGI